MKKIDYAESARIYLLGLVVLMNVLAFVNSGGTMMPVTIIQELLNVFVLPAFFILFGVLFISDKWREMPLQEFAKQQLVKLVVPYLIAEAIGIVLGLIIQKQSIAEGLMNMLTFKTNLVTDWFCPAMFIGSVLFLLAVKRLDYVSGLASVVCAILFASMMSLHHVVAVVGSGFTAYGFIVLGYLYHRFYTSKEKQTVLWTIGSVAVVLIVTAMNLKFGPNDIGNSYLTNPITMLLGGVAGTKVMLAVGKKFPMKK